MRSSSAIGAALALTACGSVELPSERTFGLSIPPAADHLGGSPQIEVLRVHDLQLTGGIDREHPMVVAGVERGRSEFDRWIAPLDRLVTDALVVELSRRRLAGLVKSEVDPGGEFWSLHGRIVEFAEVRDAAGNSAQVTLELWLIADDRLLFRDEFHSATPIAGSGTTAAVAALQRGLADIAQQLERRLRDTPPEARGTPTSPGR